MIFESQTQGAAALLFLFCGAAVYVVYEIIRATGLYSKLPVLSHITDAAFAFSAALLFIALSHFFYGGKIKYYTILCYATGALILRLTLKPPLRKFLQTMKKIYKKRVKKDTNTKEKET